MDGFLISWMCLEIGWVEFIVSSPQQSALGSSAIVKVSEQKGAAPKPIPTHSQRSQGL